MAGGIRKVYDDARAYFDPKKPPAGWSVRDNILIIGASIALDTTAEPRKKIEVSFTDGDDESCGIGIWSPKRFQEETYLVVYEAGIDTKGETSAQRTLLQWQFEEVYYPISTISGKAALTGMKQELDYIKRVNKKS